MLNRLRYTRYIIYVHDEIHKINEIHNIHKVNRCHKDTARAPQPPTNQPIGHQVNQQGLYVPNEAYFGKI